MNRLDTDMIVDTGRGTDVIEMQPGQCVVIQCNHNIGTAFIRSLTGEDESSCCRVSYRGEQLPLAGPAAVKHVGIRCLDDGLYERLKVKEYLLFWMELHDVRAPLGEMLSQIGLSQKANERIAKLSFSEKRLLGFAKSILHDPDLIVWEDPEQNLDLESCMIVRRMIDGLIQKNKAVLVTCSTLEQALSISNRIFRLTGSSITPITVQEQMELSEPEPGDNEELAAESSELQEQTPRLAKLIVKTEDKYVFIDPREIRYIESVEGMTYLYTKDAGITCTWTLAELEDRLKRFRFYRCHRSYIVNLDSITELIVWSRNSYSLVLNDDKKSKIPLSRGKFDEIKAIVGL